MIIVSATEAQAPLQEPENENRRGAKAFVEKPWKTRLVTFKATAVIIFVRTALLTHTETHTQFDAGFHPK